MVLNILQEYISQSYITLMLLSGLWVILSQPENENRSHTIFMDDYGTCFRSDKL